MNIKKEYLIIYCYRLYTYEITRIYIYIYIYIYIFIYLLV